MDKEGLGYSPWGCNRVAHDTAAKHQPQQVVPLVAIVALRWPSWHSSRFTSKYDICCVLRKIPSTPSLLKVLP